MADYEALRKKAQQLAERKWDLPAIEARCKALAATGLTKKPRNPEELLADRQQILDRVQNRAEEYNFFLGNCAMSTALAVMAEFGLGNIDVVKALAPFPGFGGTGWMCGGVTGGLISLGLYFGGDDLADHESMQAAIQAARQFMPRFEQIVGSVTCPKIQEDIVFGRYMDPAASARNMEEFQKAKGFEKCSLLPGIGARLAAEIIIESLSAPSA